MRALKTRPETKIRLAPWQACALYQPFTHFAMLCGIAVGKTFTGCMFVLGMIRNRPGATGFIGANTYDQMSQATLKELFYWLDQAGMQYVIDKRPPPSWNAPRLKSYNNILTVFHNGRSTIIFTRVLSKGDNLRGLEFSWYWIDETRDTPLNTHDVILSRLRESDWIKGLVTTTTNAEDWVYERFVKNNKGNGLFGSLHVRTEESVKAGIITQEFYSALRASYSPMMAAQELDALHVNAKGGRAYYAAGAHNQRRRAPWGDAFPSPDRPLVIGCDFNFQPAPCIWMVGQVGPDLVDPKSGLLFSDMIHWYGEITEADQPNTPYMVDKLVARYPGFFYEVYGDSSGTRGTTSNAGRTDYVQMANHFDDLGCDYSIDVNQNNPLVKNRVEAMNALFLNGLGQVRQTYDPVGCPHFRSDCNLVGWKPLSTLGGRGKLDDGGDNKRTHASDGAGYAVYKKFPVGRRAVIIPGVPAPNLRNLPV